MEINTTNNISFKGFTKNLKKFIYIENEKDIKNLKKRKPNTNGSVGQLPSFIFNKIPADLRIEAIKEILQTFDEITKIIRDFYPDPYVYIFDPTERNRPKIVNDILTNVFHKYGILKQHESIDLKYLDKGGKGKVFKISGLYDIENEEEYVIKVFYQIENENITMNLNHGCYAEINRAMYWREQEGMDTHRGKFFFANIDSGYMVTKYLDEDTRLPKRIVDEDKYGIISTDEIKAMDKQNYFQEHNFVKNYNFDYGGIQVKNYLKNSYHPVRIEVEKLKGLPKEKRIPYWIGNFYKRHNTEERLAGLALGIEYMDNKEFFINECLKLNKPKINHAIAYLLKDLDNQLAMKYFKILSLSNDNMTKHILSSNISNHNK